MVIVHVVYKMDKDNRQAFIDDLVKNRMQELTEQEPGNIQYRFSVPLDSDSEVTLTEEWESEEAIQAHFAGENIKKMGQIKDANGVTSYVHFFNAEPRK